MTPPIELQKTIKPSLYLTSSPLSTSFLLTCPSVLFVTGFFPSLSDAALQQYLSTFQAFLPLLTLILNLFPPNFSSSLPVNVPFRSKE
jgi:hypothetical protein